MSKRTRTPAASKPELRAVPSLLTEIRSARWSGGVLFLDADSGADPVTLALGPNVALQLWQALQGSIQDNAAPFNRTAATLRQSLKQEEAKP